MKMPDAQSMAAFLNQSEPGDLKTRLQSSLRQSGPAEGGSEIREVCQDFEAMFIQKMWQAMRSTLPKEGLFHSRIQEKYLNMFDRAFAQSMSRQGGIGLSEMLMRELQDRLEGVTRATDPAETGQGLEMPQPDVKTETGQQDSGTASAEEGATTAQPFSSSDRVSSQEAYRRMEALARRIEDMNGPARGSGAAETAPQNRSAGRATTAEATGRSDGQPYHKLIEPVQGEVSSEFGWRQDPFTGQRAWHSGIDLSAPEGSDVRACWPGEVVFSGEREGYGHLVILEHQNGWRSFYAHNKSNQVQQGQQVRAGQTIAEVGQSGRTTGPHLHFELRQGDMAWDPKQIERRLLAGLPIGSTVA